MSAAFELEKALRRLAEGGVVPPCALNPDGWFEGGPTRLARAEAMCRECLVIALCGRAADEQGERWGVWGGVDRTATHAISRAS